MVLLSFHFTVHCIFQVRQVSYTIAGGIQPIQNLSVLKYVGDEKKTEWGHHWINKGFHSKFCGSVSKVRYRKDALYFVSHFTWLCSFKRWQNFSWQVFGSRNPESHYQLESGIQNSVPSYWNLESTMCDPESRTILVYLMKRYQKCQLWNQHMYGH